MSEHLYIALEKKRAEVCELRKQLATAKATTNVMALLAGIGWVIVLLLLWIIPA